MSGDATKEGIPKLRKAEKWREMKECKKERRQNGRDASRNVGRKGISEGMQERRNVGVGKEG